MKKISILSLHLSYGGIETSVISLANSLSNNYNVEIACTYNLKTDFPIKANDNVKIKYLTNCVPNKKEFKEALNNKDIINIFKEGFKSIKILNKRKKTMIDYIKNTDSDIVISTRDIFNTWLGKYGKKTKIGWEHNHYHNDKKYASKIINSCKNLDCLILVSEELKKFYQSKTKCECIYIPNMIYNIPKVLSSLDEKRLISIGRLSKEKGYADLIEVYSKINKKHADWQLDIIGDGVEKEKLESIINSKNLNGSITMHGFQNKEYIDILLNKSSIYLMTSYTESFGIVLIEAMSHGIPCIAFDCAEGAKDIIIDGFNGYLISNRDYNEMAEKVNTLIEDKTLRKQLGKNAKESINKYSKEEVIKQWLKLLEEI